MRLFVIVVASLVALACDRSPQLPHEHELGEDLSPHRTLVRRLRMHERFEILERTRSSIERGDLASARRAASEFEMPVLVEMPPAARRHGDAVPERARAVATATDLASAATAYAGLLAECGGCHAAAGVTWEPVAGPIPRGDDLGDRMRRHAWASETMWEALLLAAPEPFDRAAESLTAAPLTGETPPDEERPPGLHAIEVRLRDAAIRNRTATSMDARARTYADVLGTCAACHDRIAALDR